MGTACMKVALDEAGEQFTKQLFKALNTPVAEDIEGDDSQGRVFVMTCCLDYKATENPLTCTIDGKNISILLDACQVPEENRVALTDEDCTKENVMAQLQAIGQQASDGDCFIFYYSGHGTNLKDYSGDEVDGQDEAFCFVTPDGQVCFESCMSDDDFATALTSCFSEGVKIIILTDCCHSGTIADFRSEKWLGRKAVSITGCLDAQTSGDIGRGGIFTHSMLLAIAEMQGEGQGQYSVGKLYNRTLRKDDEVFSSQQDICMMCAPDFKPNQIVWPLVPMQEYSSPLDRRG